MANSFEIRHPAAKTQDWEKIRELCCLTGNGGDPIDSNRWSFFSQQWIGPYQKLRPSWTWIAFREKKMAGYLTGCPDTQRFNRERTLGFLPPFLISYLIGNYPRNEASNRDALRLLRRTLHLEKSPENSFPSTLKTLLDQQYPAHLHINVAKEFRGSGAGQELTGAFQTALLEKGIPGLHVFCGPKPVGFYEKQGFRELAQIEFKPGIPVFALGKKLN